MKRLMMVAALAASSVGCVANQGDAPVRFLGALSLSGDAEACTPGGKQQRAAGLLDVSGGSGYLLGLSIETNTAQQGITIGNESFSGPGLNDFTLNELILTYEAQPSVALPGEERVPFYGVFRPGTSEGSYVLLFALGPKAIAQLRSSVTGDQSVTVLSTIQGRGRLSSGQEVETNAITFPITVINSGYNPATRACQDPAKKPLAAAGACGQVGQDVGPICRTPPAP